ncbi:MAG: OmpH family outer membrane protein [Alphaproteobacteria bacterium]|nr:OmpH family outer membrane protein [Alphaproteobacteria bacterium]
MTRNFAARLGASFVAVAILLLAVNPASAQEDDRTPRIGVVDLQHILRESVAAQKVRAEIEARQAQYREEIGARENALREQQQELERQRTILSPEAFAEREREFARSVEALQREVGERNRQLDETLAYGMQRVQVEALKIVARIADQLQLGLVLDKSQLLLVSKGLEFSEQALAELNAEVLSVPTTPPAE